MTDRDKVMEGLDASRRAAWRHFYEVKGNHEALLEAFDALAVSHYRMLRDYWDTLKALGSPETSAGYEAWAQQWHWGNFSSAGPQPQDAELPEWAAPFD